ncbi:armadillo-type protein [Mycena galopus ATCC 62051]|nr:armadillo-type protein [Mycena galopus ATCC 62051]
MDVLYVLYEIAWRVNGAQAIVNAKPTDYMLKLLQSPSLEVREWSSKLIRRLAGHNSIAPAVLKLCARIVSLLGHEDSCVIERVVYALSEIAQSEDGAQVVVNAKATDYLLTLLESPRLEVWQWTCKLLGTLASHWSTVPTILELNVCAQIVSSLRDKDSGVIEWAVYALYEMARWVNGAQAIVNAKATDYILVLLKSPRWEWEVQHWTCELTGSLASHKSTAPAILKLEFCAQLVSSLRDEDSQWAVYALSRIAQSEDGAQAIVKSQATDHVLMLLESPNPYTRQWTCNLVGVLASHGSTAPAILELNMWARIVSLLGDDYTRVIESATYALSQIAQWVDGAQAIIDAKATDQILILLHAHSSIVRTRTCELVGNLASHKSTVPSVLTLKSYERLASLIRRVDSPCTILAHSYQ